MRFFLINEEPYAGIEVSDDWLVNDRTCFILERDHDVEFTWCGDEHKEDDQKDDRKEQDDPKEHHLAMEAYEEQNYPTAIEKDKRKKAA